MFANAVNGKIVTRAASLDDYRGKKDSIESSAAIHSMGKYQIISGQRASSAGHFPSMGEMYQHRLIKDRWVGSFSTYSPFNPHTYFVYWSPLLLPPIVAADVGCLF